MARKLEQLTPEKARRTLAHRLSPRADRLRQIATNFGIRPYNVSLVWGKWSGEERGEGTFKVIKSIALLPNPKVEDMSAVSLDPRAAGVLPVGTIKLTRVSSSYNLDTLSGRTVPQGDGERIPEDVEFFYELTEDGRGEDNPVRMRFRLVSEPFRRPGKIDWTILLERVSEDRARDGSMPIGANR